MRGRLTTLSVSAESGVQRVVDQIVDKQLDLTAIVSVAERAQAARVPLLVHFMIGLPGETRREVNGTLGFAADLADRTGASPSMQFATPLPGTRLARMAKGKVALPVVRDYGPLFQQEPSIASEDVPIDFLRRARGAFDERARVARGPKRVVLHLTYRCNNRCPFCTTGTGAQVDGDHDEQQRMLIEYRQLGATLLSLDGGEPTLSDRLFRVVASARKLGYDQIHLTTNGRMASYRAYAERLVNSGLTSIDVSIHGPDAATHAENVGVPEAFEQTCAGVRNLVALAPPRVALGATITVTRSNHDKLLDVARLVFDLGLRRLELRLVTPFGPATPSVSPDPAAAAREAMRVIDAFADRMTIQVHDLPRCFLPGYERFAAPDLLQIPGHVLLADTRGVDPHEYQRARRAKKPVCEECPHRVFCDGFYQVEGAPHPPWLPAAGLAVIRT
jgi:MoaA/NifB/PqqE/SkfB family radical SAM enzyme